MIANFPDKDYIDLSNDDVEQHNAVGNGTCESKSKTDRVKPIGAERIRIKIATTALLGAEALVDTCSLSLL